MNGAQNCFHFSGTGGRQQATHRYICLLLAICLAAFVGVSCSTTSVIKSTDQEAAKGNYGEALALANELGMRPLVAHCHFEFGKLLRQLPEAEQARQHLGAAAMLYREMDMRGWLDQLEAELRASA